MGCQCGGPEKSKACALGLEGYMCRELAMEHFQPPALPCRLYLAAAYPFSSFRIISVQVATFLVPAWAEKGWSPNTCSAANTQGPFLQAPAQEAHPDVSPLTNPPAFFFEPLNLHFLETVADKFQWLDTLLLSQRTQFKPLAKEAVPCQSFPHHRPRRLQPTGP